MGYGGVGMIFYVNPMARMMDSYFTLLRFERVRVGSWSFDLIWTHVGSVK